MSSEWGDPVGLLLGSGRVIKVDSVDQLKYISAPDVSLAGDCAYCKTMGVMGSTNCPNCGAAYEKRRGPIIMWKGVYSSIAVMLILLLSSCATLDNPNLLAAALIMQGQANAMAQTERGPVTCTPFGEGFSCRQW